MSRTLSILAALLALCANARGGHLWLSVMDAPASTADLDSIPGCIAFWSALDAGDRVMNGVAVTNLLDKSGNGRTATLVGTNCTIAAGAINGHDAIHFANSSSFSFGNVPISNFTVVAVFQRSSAGISSIGIGSSNDVALAWWYTDNKIYVQYGGGYKYSGAITSTGNYWTVTTLTTNYAGISLYLNGTNVSLPSVFAVETYGYLLNRIGKTGDKYYNAGRAGCWAIYDHVLLESDRATVDAIIKAKWGF